MTTPDFGRPADRRPDDDTSTYDAPAAQRSEEPPLESPWPSAPDAPSPPAPAAAEAPPAGVTPMSPPVPTAAAAPPWAGPRPAPNPVVPPPGTPTPNATPPSWAPPAAARPSTPAGLVLGVILVVVGGALLLGRVVEFSLAGVTWPVWIVVPGVAMLIGSFFIPARGGVGLAVAGSIVTIVGLILWVQEAYGLYSTWAYAWALVAPTGPGIGMLLYGLVHRDGKLVGDGVRMAIVGLGLFLGFALFFEGVIGLSGTPIANLDEVLPYAIVGLGILLVILSFAGRGDQPARPAR
jgi:hypothetical protein